MSVHPEFQKDRAALARIESQIAFAQAAGGAGGKPGRGRSGRLRRRPLNLRGWLALLISVRLVSADAIGRLANRFGKGI